MKWTLTAVCFATALNIGLWLLSARTIGSQQRSTPVQSAPTAASTAQCPVPVLSVSSASEPKAEVPAKAGEVDQPWLNTVRDSVMQLSMSPKFADKVTL